MIRLVGSNRIRKDIEKPVSSILENYPQKTYKVHEILNCLTRVDDENTLENGLKSIHLDSDTIDLTHSDPNIALSDYVKCWKRPHMKDLAELKNLKQGLAQHEDEIGIEHAIKFACGAIKNLPAEFFLQPPYIYKSLFDCLNIHKFEWNVLSALRYLTKSLQSRIKFRSLTRTCEFNFDDEPDAAKLKCQVSISCYCYQLFMVIITYLKEIEVHSNQDRINVYFEVMSEVVDLVRLSQSTNEIKAILRELSFFARFYREEYQKSTEKFTFRVNYIVILQMIVMLAPCVCDDISNDFVNDHDYDKKEPIWKTELKISLMDFTLR